jgi:aldose 1-epimerase
MRETPPPSGAQHYLEFEDQNAIVVEVGGGLRGYTVAGQDIFDGYALDELAPVAAGQVLAPWPNRIRDGRYAWDGHTYQVALTEPVHDNAIHGLVRWVPWTATPVSESAVTLSYLLPPHPGYPWAVELTTTWSLGPDGLRASHTATNHSGTPAPFGLGAHPYLQLPGVPVDDLVLTVPGERVLLTDRRGLPIGASPVAGTDLDFTTGRRLGPVRLDTAFGPAPDGGSAVRMSTVDGSVALTVWADGSFRWWQVFTSDGLGPPRTRRSAAVEPMTCPPDAYRSRRDLVTLEPGQTWRGEWGIRPEVTHGV